MGDEELRNAVENPLFFEGGQRGILQTPGYNVIIPNHCSEPFGGA